MHVDIGESLHHRGDFRSRRTCFDELAAEDVADLKRDGRGSGARYDDTRSRRGQRRRQAVRGGQDDALGRQCHRTGDQFTVPPERHMHRPAGGSGSEKPSSRVRTESLPGVCAYTCTAYGTRFSDPGHNTPIR